jgi:hypothetical protein
MQTLDHDESSIHVAASPEAVYDHVADITNTPGLSPEIVSASWIDGADGPAVGARFVARNRAGRMAWSNKPVVVTADRGRAFAFARTEPFAGTVEWRYRFTPEDGGTRVVESYEVTRPITRTGWFIIGGLAGCKDRRSDLQRGMQQTLQRLKQRLEGAPQPSAADAAAPPA